MGAYNASFIELAEKLKQLNDDTKRLKAQIKDLTEKIENITAVTKELVKIKQETKTQSQVWENEKKQYIQQINKLQNDMTQQARTKIESINKYNVEMNNLRTNIKTLQRRINAQELENEKMREMDSQSVLGSAANWVPGNWWSTKK